MIPKIDVRSLVAKKTYAGELSFSYDASEVLDLPYAEFASPVQAELTFCISEDDKVEISGSITFTLKGSCSRCLSAAEQTFTEEVHAVFEAGGGDGETYGYSNGRVELDEFIRDAVAFALPSVLLCGECEIPDGEQE